jgi:hypothetical protein
VLVAAVIVTTATTASGELYRWVDRDGVIHYTSTREAIPEAYRDAAQELEHPTAREAQLSAAPAPESAGPRTPGAAIVVDAHLNGVGLRLLVDTGADRTVISPTALSRAGIDPNAGPPVRVIGVTGSATAPLVTVPRLDLAGTRVGPLGIIAHSVPGDDIDGLLGRDVLEAFMLTVDRGTNRVVLTPR